MPDTPKKVVINCSVPVYEDIALYDVDGNELGTETVQVGICPEESVGPLSDDELAQLAIDREESERLAEAAAAEEARNAAEDERVAEVVTKGADASRADLADALAILARRQGIVE